jgi:hypothetical protein
MKPEQKQAIKAARVLLKKAINCLDDVGRLRPVDAAPSLVEASSHAKAAAGVLTPPKAKAPRKAKPAAKKKATTKGKK